MCLTDYKEPPESRPKKDPSYTKTDQRAVKKKLDELTIKQLRMVCMLVKQIGGS